ncbi:MAG: hypothetical protein KGJ92_08415 [Actinomycetales bacterium]|nr:hypothetical protein [Actinomycetales bacterium]
MQIVGAEEIERRVASLGIVEPRVVVSGNFATPWTLLGIVDRALERYRAFVLNPQRGWPHREGLITESPFVGEGARGSEDVEFLPMRLSLVPRLFATSRPPDVVLVQSSAPHRGRISLGIEVNILPAAIHEVKRRGGLVIAQVNAQMPYTMGDGEIDLELVDLALEVDEALPSPSARVVDEAAAAIGEHIASLASDGTTLQMGIGLLPDAALTFMHGRRHLGVWSEMISDGVMGLDRSGSIDPDRVITTTFLYGTPDLYRWVHRNPRVVMRRTEVANNPARIAEQAGMLSINTALEVDLFAQANASYVRGAVYSGFGGQPDFVSGALHSRGGQAVLALRSWHEKSDQSTIVPLLTSPVCSFQHSAIITEQGIASIFGQSQCDQASAIIACAANPRARDSLIESAKAMGILRQRHLGVA